MNMRLVSLVYIVTLVVVLLQLPADAKKGGGNGKPRKNRYPCTRTNNQCQNGATCRPNKRADLGFNCLCRDGFYGDLCSNQHLSTTPASTPSASMPASTTSQPQGNRNALNDGCAGTECLNGGVCFNIPTAYICICAAGFMGQNCENDVNECASDPCQNGGQCSDESNGYACTCEAGWKGNKCQSQCLSNIPLGMESGDIPDSSITASRYKKAKDFDRLPHYARLGEVRFWAAYVSQEPWIQVDLQDVVDVSGIMTQGDDGTPKYWIAKLKVQTGLTVDELTNVVNADGTEIFNANTGPATIATIYWPKPIAARFIRILPTECLRAGKRGTCVLRFEILGSEC